jgi:hypothetical protein
VAVFDDLNVDHLWMTFGKGKDLRWIPIHYIVRSLIGTLFTGKEVKACIIYFIGTAGPIVHDDSKFFEYTDFTLGQIVTWGT